MKTQIAEKYVYEGLGFPIELEKVEMAFIDNDWHPKIDVQKVADEVIAKLAIQETRLTGNQVKFIRSYYSMPLREFAEKVVHESHAAVNKWEKKGNLLTNMNANTEHELRLFIIENVFSRSKEKKLKFYDFYMATKRFFNNNTITAKMIHSHS